MAHFVEIDSKKQVIKVLVLEDKDTQDVNGDEVESIGAKYLEDTFGGTWLRTSYNTIAGEHVKGGTPFRINYAGIGFIYDEAKDAFIPPQPFSSWTLNKNTCQWESPIEYPNDGKDYTWNEDTKSWDLVNE